MAVSTKTRGKGQNANKMTPEIYFARRLASNEKKIRDKSLKKLRRWITAKSAVPDGIYVTLVGWHFQNVCFNEDTFFS